MKRDEFSSGQNQQHFQRYLNYVVSILEQYNGGEPFHLFLKKYFSQNKKHGSKDRKRIASLCYDYFRIGEGVINMPALEEKLLISTFLLGKESAGLLEKNHPTWLSWIQLPVSEKLEKISELFTLDKLFPFRSELSDQIDWIKFNFSFLIQPKLFIRIRPGGASAVYNKLNTSGIAFEKIRDDCLSFTLNEKISDILKIDKEAVIQDYNSQRISEFFLPVVTGGSQPIKVWDCCAASGGKSILAFDKLENILLTVSDIRKGILANLKTRFQKAGIQKYHSFVADLSMISPVELCQHPQNFIIADVPCSGSGTWGRTPEQLSFFQEKRIDEYARLQKQIVTNAEKCLAINGYFLYVTCSVFKKENEENVFFITNTLHLELVKCSYLKGYEMQADTLFAALFRKVS